MLLTRRQFLVKERVSMMKLADTYDLFDPATGSAIGVARDEPAGWAKWLRLLVSKQLLPTTVRVYESEGAPASLTLTKAPALLRPTVVVLDASGRELGRLRSKLFSLGGGFWVHDPSGQPIAQVKGDWKGWNFRFLDQHGRELGQVTKKWAGLGKELFTSADNYLIALDDASSSRPDTAAMLLAAGLAIDLVFKEKK
jgi:uncharacterized protein YxjI